VNMRRLGELSLFSGLDEEALRAIAAAVVEESVEEGRVLVREGDFSQDLTIIDEGTASVEHDGQELTQLTAGDMFGEMGLMRKEQRNATVRAATDMRLIHLTKFDLNRLRGPAPQILERINEIVESRS
jgi:CRP-like cAMP-binding protein